MSYVFRFLTVGCTVLRLAGQRLVAHAGAGAPQSGGWEGHSTWETGLGAPAPWGSAGSACFQLDTSCCFQRTDLANSVFLVSEAMGRFHSDCSDWFLQFICYSALCPIQFRPL